MGDRIVVLWKTDTERTTEANYFTLEAGGSLLVRKGDGRRGKRLSRRASMPISLAVLSGTPLRHDGPAVPGASYRQL